MPANDDPGDLDVAGLARHLLAQLTPGERMRFAADLMNRERPTTREWLLFWDSLDEKPGDWCYID